MCGLVIGAGHAGTPAQSGSGAWELADLLRRLPESSVQPTGADQQGQHRKAEAEVGASDAHAGKSGGHAAGGRWRDVCHAASERCVRARCRDRAAVLVLRPQPAREDQRLLRSGESRAGHAWQSFVHGHGGRTPGGAGCENRRRDLGRRGGRSHEGLQRDGGPAGRERQDHHGRRGRRVRHPRLRGRLRRRDRQARLALPHHTRAWGAGIGDVEGQRVENRRGLDVGNGLLRSAVEPSLLGNRQRVAGLEWRRASGRQSVYGERGGAVARHRKAEVAFPIHSARRARLRRGADPCAGGRRIPGAPAQAHVLGQSQRFLLRAGSRNRRIPAGHSLRETDLGRAHRRKRPSRAEGRRGSDARRNSRLSGRPGRHQLVFALVQSAHRIVLSFGLGIRE